MRLMATGRRRLLRCLAHMPRYVRPHEHQSSRRAQARAQRNGLITLHTRNLKIPQKEELTDRVVLEHSDLAGQDPAVRPTVEAREKKGPREELETGRPCWENRIMHILYRDNHRLTAPGELLVV